MSVKNLLFLIVGFYISYLGVYWGIIFVVCSFLYFYYLKETYFKYVVVSLMVLWRVFDWCNGSLILEIMNEEVAYDVSGVICMEPDIRRGDVRYGICIDKIEGVEMDGRFLWKNSKNNLYEIGDIIELECIFEVPFEENGFSYKNYLKIFKIDLICDGFMRNVVEGDLTLKKIILKWKNLMIGYYDQKLLEPVSSLMNGILFGSRRGFADEIMDQFGRTGLTHIIAVSGYNVALVVLVIEYFGWWIPRGKRFYIICLSLMIFAFLTGLSASVIRACVMGGLSLWGLRSGENVNFWKVLFMCILFMGFWNPAYLLYDVSLHLSVLATLGVVIGGRFIDMEEGKDFVGMKEAFYMTVFAQIFTTPLIILKFDYLSLISPFANVLVAPLLPVLMFLGCLLLVSEILLPFYFFQFGIIFMIEIFGVIFFKIVSMMSKVSLLVVDLENMNREVLVSIYVLFFVLLLIWLSIYKKRN